MGLLGAAKQKVGLMVVERLGKDIGAGGYGARAASVYKLLAGKGAFVGAVVALIIGALEAFQPEYSGAATRYLGLAGLGLTALGITNKLYLNEPIFEPWFLDVVRHVSSTLTWISGSLLMLDEWLDVVAPQFTKFDGLEEHVKIGLTAGVMACAFINRFATASGATAVTRTSAQEAPAA